MKNPLWKFSRIFGKLPAKKWRLWISTMYRFIETKLFPWVKEVIHQTALWFHGLKTTPPKDVLRWTEGLVYGVKIRRHSDVKPADTMEQERYTLIVNAPNYIHGENTKEALIERRIGLRVLYRLYLLGLKHGMFTKGSRLRGRPPNIKKP